MWRPIDAYTSEVVESHRHGAAVLAKRQVIQVRAQACDRRAFDRAHSAHRKCREPLLHIRQLGRQDFALGPVHFQSKTELVPPFPRVRREQG